MNKILKHKTESSYKYKDMKIHAAPGLHEYIAEELKKILPEKGNILELGAGGGALTQRLIDLGYNVTASDINSSDFIPKSKFIQADLNSEFCKKFIDVEFDCIIAIETIEHLENPVNFLRQIKSMLSKDNFLLISFPNIYLYSAAIGFLKKGDFINWNSDQYWDTGHQTILTDWLIEEHCKQVGLYVSEKNFCAPIVLKDQYKNLIKRSLVILFITLLRLVSRAISYEMRVSDCILFNIKKNIKGINSNN